MDKKSAKVLSDWYYETCVKPTIELEKLRGGGYLVTKVKLPKRLNDDAR